MVVVVVGVVVVVVVVVRITIVGKQCKTTPLSQAWVEHKAL